MFQLPALVLYNPYWRGDNVLLEPIARKFAEVEALPGSALKRDILVASEFPEIFQEHPIVKGVRLSEIPSGSIVINMADAIRSAEGSIPISGKLERMYKAAGLEYDKTPPKLYLSDEEHDLANKFANSFFGNRIAIVLDTNAGGKDWPYFEALISKLTSDKRNNVFVVSNTYKPYFDYIKKYGVNAIFDRPLREVMAYLSAMDVVVGGDTGPMHIAAALGAPIVVIGFEVFEELYEPYSRVIYVSVSDKNTLGLISPRRVYRAVRRMLAPGNKRLRKPPRPAMGLMVLEGLGGTVTASDHVKKIYDKLGVKTTLVIRKYADLFDKNPYVEDIMQVGMIDHNDCINRCKGKFENFAAIKTGIGVWINHTERWMKNTTPPDFMRIFKQYPTGLNELEKYELNATQLADLSLGLPYETAELEVYDMTEPAVELPLSYVVFSTGVDVWHKGLVQTKSWPIEYWQELVNLMCGVPMVQVGTDYDAGVRGAVDLRRKTNVKELLWVLKNASAVVTIEGGLMHLSKAVGQKNVIVVRGPTAGHVFGYPEFINLDPSVCKGCYWETLEWYKECPRGLGAACMRKTTPAMVAEALQGVLNGDMVKNGTMGIVKLGNSVQTPGGRIIRATQHQGASRSYSTAG